MAAEEVKGFYPGHVNQKGLQLDNSFPDHLVKDVSEILTLLKEDNIKQVKEIIRNNHWPINHPIRRHLWQELCIRSGREKHVEGFYNDMVQELLGEHRSLPVLPPFADPAFCIHYHLNTESRKGTERILCIVAHTHPSITYSPLLYPLVCLFMHYMSEEEAFNSICDIVSAERTFVGQTKLLHQAKSTTLIKLTKKFARSAYVYLEKEMKGTDALENMFLGWEGWIFKCFPFPYLVRIMDCFLLEGTKTLYRIVLALLILYNKHTEKERNEDEGAMEGFLTFCQTMPVAIDKLFKVAYGIRGFSGKLIVQHLLKAEMIQKSQINAHERAGSLDRMIKSTSGQHLHPTSSATCNIERRANTRAQSTCIVPLGKFKSEILSDQQISEIWGWLPPRITMLHPEVIFSTNEHGTCLRAFHIKVSSLEPTILVVKNGENEVFGAYCSSSWSSRRNSSEGHFFGTGESFLFTFSPGTEKFPWVGLDSEQDVPHSSKLFMTADSTMICIGSGNGRGLWLDENLMHGRTEKCDTFNNSPLCTKADFVCKIVEVIAFK